VTPRALIAEVTALTVLATCLVAEVAVLAPVAGASLADAVIADSPVSFWRFNETSGSTAVDAMGNHDGAMSGGVTMGATGPGGTGLRSTSMAVLGMSI